MIDIEMQEVSPQFAECWRAAGRHLSNQVQGGIQSWLRAHMVPPFLEHLSFRLGNQLYFVRIEDGDGRLETPGSMRGLFAISDGCNGHACLMPMKKNFLGGNWEPVLPGWGLIDARTKRSIDPVSLVTDEKIEMTPWELHDFAVQVVRDQIKKEEFDLMSSQGNPGVEPSIWFVGNSRAAEWVVVRAARYPETDRARPANWADIAKQYARLSPVGHYASVVFASTDQGFSAAKEPPVPIWRGYGVHVRYKGLAR